MMFHYLYCIFVIARLLLAITDQDLHWVLFSAVFLLNKIVFVSIALCQIPLFLMLDRILIIIGILSGLTD